MNLAKKKSLAARTLNVGKARIIFVKERLTEIKEAITKQDIRDLKKEGAILIKEIKGRKKKLKKKLRRTTGNVRKKVSNRKQEYVKMTRKLRNYAAEMKEKGKLSREEIKEIRKKIRNRAYRSLAHFKELTINKEKVTGKTKVKKTEGKKK